MGETNLPDDIEQLLLDGRRHDAVYALMHRRHMTRNEARAEIGRWLFERNLGGFEGLLGRDDRDGGG
jgi:hypothetical protein